MPIGELPWYAEFIKIWSRQKINQYQCVDDLVRQRKVTFVCQSGETRAYNIKVVRSCMCKRTIRHVNQSTPEDKPTDERDREGIVAVPSDPSDSVNGTALETSPPRPPRKGGKKKKEKKNKKGKRRKSKQHATTEQTDLETETLSTNQVP